MNLRRKKKKVLLPLMKTKWMEGWKSFEYICVIVWLTVFLRLFFTLLRSKLSTGDLRKGTICLAKGPEILSNSSPFARQNGWNCRIRRKGLQNRSLPVVRLVRHDIPFRKCCWKEMVRPLLPDDTFLSLGSLSCLCKIHTSSGRQSNINRMECGTNGMKCGTRCPHDRFGFYKKRIGMVTEWNRPDSS